MISIRQFSKTLTFLTRGCPSYKFMKGLEKYQKVFPPLEENHVLVQGGIEAKLSKNVLSKQDLTQIIQKKQFQNYVYNIAQQEQNEEYNLDLSEQISQEQTDKLQSLSSEIISLLESKQIDNQTKLQLYEQTIMLDEIQKHFLTKMMKGQNYAQKKLIHQLLQVLCNQYSLIFNSSSNKAPPLDLSKLTTVAQNLQRKDILQNLSLYDIALLLNVDYVLFKKELQSQLVSQAINMILSIKTFNPELHSKALNIIFKYSRRHHVKLSSDSKVILHLIEILPIQELNQIMKEIKITNYEYTDVVKFYAAMQKKYFAAYNPENIPLLSTMNVYIPAMSAANFYLNHLQTHFDSGNYLECMILLPDYINLFYPKHELINYISDRLQVKLSTSNYAIIDQQSTKEQKIIFIQKLSVFLVSLLQSSLIKNDFFLMKTLLFLKNNYSLIQDKNTLIKLSYFFNQINDNGYQDEIPLNQNIKDQIEEFNNQFPPRQSIAIASNTETKIFKFLLQTNHFALQNVRVGSFNIDILVHPDLIVEYNGFDHYKFDLKSKGYNLDQFTLQHKYREKQLKKLNNYKIANINFKQWGAQYDLDKQYNFLKNLVLSFE